MRYWVSSEFIGSRNCVPIAFTLSPEWSSRHSYHVYLLLYCGSREFDSCEKQNLKACKVKFNHWLTSCKSAELALGRDKKILCDHRQDGNVAVGGIGTLARWP